MQRKDKFEDNTVRMKYTIDQRVRLLKKAEPFSSLDDFLLTEIAQYLEEKEVKAQTVLFEKGDEGNTLFIIAEGAVKVFDEEHVFAKLSEGQTFGEFSLFEEGAKRTANVITLQRAFFLTLERESFFEIAGKNKSLVMAMTRQLTKYISEKSSLEKQLLESNAAISKKNKEIEAKNRELLQINEEKNQLLGIIAHDLRNPLTAAMVVAELLNEYAMDAKEDLSNSISLINSSLKRIGTMVDRILDLKNLESANHAPVIKAYSLPSLITDLLNSLENQAAQKRIGLKLEIQNCKAMVDHERFRQICENLISNSIKFSPDHSQITVGLKECEHCIKLTISDQGPGFSEDDKRKMFGKFQRLSAQPTGGESSTGLGLSIVKQYVDDLNGKIYLNSEVGKGAAFIVEFRKG